MVYLQVIEPPQLERSPVPVEIWIRTKLASRSEASAGTTLYLVFDGSGDKLKLIDMREGEKGERPPHRLIDVACATQAWPTPEDQAFWSHWLTHEDLTEDEKEGAFASLRRFVIETVGCKHPKRLAQNTIFKITLPSKDGDDRIPVCELEQTRIDHIIEEDD